MKHNEESISKDAIGTIICPKCDEIMARGYYTILNSCPNCGCVEEPVIIDELLAPTIVELNKKGYRTKACCSSHIYDKHGYIAFYNDELLESIQKYSNGKIKFNNCYDIELNDKFCIRWECVDYHKGYSRAINQVVAVNKMLYKWARSLPKK